MKATLGFDPNDYDYGPATSAIRTIIFDWADIDWYVASAAADEELRQIFREHNALAHRHAPELFAEHIEPRCVSGGAAEFLAWCKRVRAQTQWDWKFSVLKRLSNKHSKARGWSLDEEAARLPEGSPRPGDLFFRLKGTAGSKVVLWNALVSTRSILPTESSAQVEESARFYLSHAQADVYCALQWQLAEPDADLSHNPFVPLLRCYRAGGYPFSLARDTVVLFRFIANEHEFPKATLLPTRR